jgi:hypothetical protein
MSADADGNAIPPPAKRILRQCKLSFALPKQPKGGGSCAQVREFPGESSPPSSSADDISTPSVSSNTFSDSVCNAMHTYILKD